MECLEPPYSKNKGKGREGYLPVNNIVMKWKGIIFDLDGVLCSTDQYHYMAWKRVADQLPVYFDEEINQRLRGVSRAESLEIILEKYTGTPLHTLEKQKILAEKNQIYRTALEQMNEQDLSAEVRDTILRLREKGYSLAVGSSSKNARFILGRLGLYAASAGHTGKEADMTIEKKTGLAECIRCDNRWYSDHTFKTSPGSISKGCRRTRIKTEGLPGSGGCRRRSGGGNIGPGWRLPAWDRREKII